MKKTKGEIIELIKNKFNLKSDYKFDVELGEELRGTKIFYTCDIHGVSQFYWSNLTGGNKFLGCKVCRNLSKSKKIFTDKLDMDKCILMEEYMSAKLPLKMKCLVHDFEFISSRNAYLSKGEYCPKCRKDENKEKWKNIFIEKSSQIHNNYYDYSRVVYDTVMNSVEIICPEHGIFHQSPDAHMRGQKCIKCSMSYPENYIKNFLESINISYIHGKGLKILTNPETGYPLKPDFYLPDYNLIIEYDGAQHFKPMYPDDFEYIQKLDKLKNDLCLLHNINIMRFNKNNVDTLEDSIIKFIAKYNP
jgi:hypothetical protein